MNHFGAGYFRLDTVCYALLYNLGSELDLRYLGRYENTKLSLYMLPLPKRKHLNTALRLSFSLLAARVHHH
jgi:hypothetical protein